MPRTTALHISQSLLAQLSTQSSLGERIVKNLRWFVHRSSTPFRFMSCHVMVQGPKLQQCPKYRKMAARKFDIFCSPNVLQHFFHTGLQPACCNSNRAPRNPTTSRWPFLAATIRGLCSIIGGALVFVGTGLNQKLDNFKVPILSCYV